MKTMTWWKLKFAIEAGVTMLVVGGAATVAISQIKEAESSPAALEILRQSQRAYASLSSYSDTCSGTTSSGASSLTTTCSIKLERPNQYRVEWRQTGGSFESRGVIWSDGSGHFEVMSRSETFASAPVQRNSDMRQAFAGANGVSSSLASTVPCAFFKLPFGNKLGAAPSDVTSTKRKPDEKIGDTDCYVVVSVLDAAKLGKKVKEPVSVSNRVKNVLSGTITTTFWIGKADNLIRKVQTETSGSSSEVNWTDEMLERRLKALNKPVTPENIAAEREAQKKARELINKTGIVFTETHENIIVNRRFPSSDFTR